MSNIKTAVETAISNIKQVADNPYSASTYTVGEVLMLLSSLLADAEPAGTQILSGTTSHTHVTLSPRVQKIGITEEQWDDLYENIRDHITATADDLSGDDVIDRDSLEVSISGQYAAVENVSIDSSNISDAINEDIETVLNDWLRKHDITLLPNE